MEVDVAGELFSSIVLETPSTAAYLRAGHEVEILFKETEVSIAKGLSGQISIRNRFKAAIREIQRHDILTTVVLNYQQTSISSVISTRSADRLGLKEGDVIEWLVKTNEMSLCPLT